MTRGVDFSDGVQIESLLSDLARTTAEHVSAANKKDNHALVSLMGETLRQGQVAMHEQKQQVLLHLKTTAEDGMAAVLEIVTSLQQDSERLSQLKASVDDGLTALKTAVENTKAPAQVHLLDVLNDIRCEMAMLRGEVRMLAAHVTAPSPVVSPTKVQPADGAALEQDVEVLEALPPVRSPHSDRVRVLQAQKQRAAVESSSRRTSPLSAGGGTPLSGVSLLDRSDLGSERSVQHQPLRSHTMFHLETAPTSSQGSQHESQCATAPSSPVVSALVDMLVPDVPPVGGAIETRVSAGADVVPEDGAAVLPVVEATPAAPPRDMDAVTEVATGADGTSPLARVGVHTQVLPSVKGEAAGVRRRIRIDTQEFVGTRPDVVSQMTTRGVYSKPDLVMLAKRIVGDGESTHFVRWSRMTKSELATAIAKHLFNIAP